jgi:hypothetical protein
MELYWAAHKVEDAKKDLGLIITFMAINLFVILLSKILNL